MAIGARVDKEKLRGAMQGKITTIAERLGINRVSLSKRLAKPLSLEDLTEICFYLDRDVNEFLVSYQPTIEEMQGRRKKRDELKQKRKLVAESKIAA